MGYGKGHMALHVGFSHVTSKLVVLGVLIGFGTHTSTNETSLAEPLAEFMLQRHVAFHVQMEKLSSTSSFSKTVGSHITRVNPKQVLENKFIEELPEVLHMRKQGFLGWLLYESGRDSSKD